LKQTSTNKRDAYPHPAPSTQSQVRISRVITLAGILFENAPRGADRSAQVLVSNLTYPGRYLFTQTDPYPRVAILPELVFGAIIGTVVLIDCVPIEKVEGQPYANGRCC